MKRCFHCLRSSGRFLRPKYYPGVLLRRGAYLNCFHKSARPTNLQASTWLSLLVHCTTTPCSRDLIHLVGIVVFTLQRRRKTFLAESTLRFLRAESPIPKYFHPDMYIPRPLKIRRPRLHLYRVFFARCMDRELLGLPNAG
jgi:hypothetical protein